MSAPEHIPDAVQQALDFGDRYPEILQLNLEQLRIIFLLHHLGSMSKIAKYTGKQQTSIIKTIQAVENKLMRITKEPIINRSLGRNKFELVQPFGDMIVNFAGAMLEQASQTVQKVTTQSEPAVLRIGVVTFQMPLLARVRNKLVIEADRKKIPYSLKLTHTHTSEMFSMLREGVVDTVVGGWISPIGQAFLDDSGEFEFIPHHEEELGLLGWTKHVEKSITFDEIAGQKIPVLLPNKGAAHDFIASETGLRSMDAIKSRFNVTDWSNDINMIIEMLRLGMYDTNAIAVRCVYEALQEQKTFKDISFYPIKGARHTMKYGFFLRKGERHKYSQRHPLSLFWHCCEQEL